jgi:hypothetical protein
MRCGGSDPIMIELNVQDGLYIVKLPKIVLILTREEFIQALRRGKWWKRRAAIEARPSPIPSR